MTRRILAVVGTLFGVFLVACRPGRPAMAISGVVRSEAGPVAGAVVRVQATDIHTHTDANGEFNFSGFDPEETVNLTAWVPGYFIAAAQDVSPSDSDVEIHLEAHAASDNPNYAWLPSTVQPGEGEDQGCAECHSDASGGLTYTLPVDEWLQDAHAGSALNLRFLTMYNGTDLEGNQSPPTRYASSRDYGSFPLRPDLEQPYYGPGYKLDFPETAGNCAACHTPAASVNDPYGVDPAAVSGVVAEGVPCDFCHKVWDVRLDQYDLPFPNMPGVLSYTFRRPPEGHQFFAGPFDDVAPGEDTYSPLQSTGQFCAPCHFGVFWDTLVYNSYGEWLASSYNEPENGQTCQDCHMPPLGNTHFALPEAGGQERDPDTIFSHRMPGASDEILLQNAVSMMVVARREGGQVLVEVEIVNDRTGHHVPTDSPLRQLLLLVQVSDANGVPLEQVDGPVLPEWAGQGNPAQGYYAGLPGMAYAKVLQELWTEVAPSGAYWNPTRVLSDNRIPAMASDTTRYAFAGIAEPVTVEVRLLFRRAYIELLDQKGWDVPDILMEEKQLHLP
jgi:hypothetical protein